MDRGANFIVSFLDQIQLFSTILNECFELSTHFNEKMRKLRRTIHKQVGGVGNFFAIILLVAITVILINTSILSKRHCKKGIASDSFRSLLFHLAPVSRPEDHRQSEENFNNQSQTFETLSSQTISGPRLISRPTHPDAGMFSFLSSSMDL